VSFVTAFLAPIWYLHINENGGTDNDKIPSSKRAWRFASAFAKSAAFFASSCDAFGVYAHGLLEHSQRQFENSSKPSKRSKRAKQTKRARQHEPNTLARTGSGGGPTSSSRRSLAFRARSAFSASCAALSAGRGGALFSGGATARIRVGAFQFHASRKPNERSV
jgi:hypothetical protein